MPGNELVPSSPSRGLRLASGNRRSFGELSVLSAPKARKALPAKSFGCCVLLHCTSHRLSHQGTAAAVRSASGMSSDEAGRSFWRASGKRMHGGKRAVIRALRDAVEPPKYLAVRQLRDWGKRTSGGFIDAGGHGSGFKVPSSRFKVAVGPVQGFASRQVRSAVRGE
jgi:hypothetical protein